MTDTVQELLATDTAECAPWRHIPCVCCGGLILVMPSCQRAWHMRCPPKT